MSNAYNAGPGGLASKAQARGGPAVSEESRLHAWWVMPSNLYAHREYSRPKHTTTEVPRPVYRAEEVDQVIRDLAEARAERDAAKHAGGLVQDLLTKAEAERDRLAERVEEIAKVAGPIVGRALREALAAFRSPSNGEGQG